MANTNTDPHTWDDDQIKARLGQSINQWTKANNVQVSDQGYYLSREQLLQWGVDSFKECGTTFATFLANRAGHEMAGERQQESVRTGDEVPADTPGGTNSRPVM